MADYGFSHWDKEELMKEAKEARRSETEDTPLLGVAWPSGIQRTFASGGPLPTDASERSKALNEAEELINGDRDLEYGPPEVNFQRIADILNVLIPLGDREWTPGLVTLALLGVKLGRTPQGYKRDTYVDIAGYAALAVELFEKEND